MVMAFRRVAAVTRPRFDGRVSRLARGDLVRATLAAAALALGAWALDRVEVVGTSMLPTFRPGDRLLLVRRFRRLRVGDLVALKDPTCSQRTLVKRVRSIDAGSAIVVGDNDQSSTDSRRFGAVPLAGIQRLVVRRYARVGEP